MRKIILLPLFIAAVTLAVCVATAAAANSDGTTPYCVGGKTVQADSGLADFFNYALAGHASVYSYPGGGYSSLPEVEGQQGTLETIQAGACPGGEPSGPPSGPPVSTPSAPPRPADMAFYCSTETQGNPWVASVSVVTQHLSGTDWAPYWVEGAAAGGTNLGSGHLTCALPDGMTPDGAVRGAGGQLIAGASAWVDHLGGYYPEATTQ